MLVGWELADMFQEIIYTTKNDLDLELVITSNATGIFSVGLQSSLGPCANTTIPTNSTPTASSTSAPTQFTGGAIPSGNFGGASGVVVALFGFLFTAYML